MGGVGLGRLGSDVVDLVWVEILFDVEALGMGAVGLDADLDYQSDGLTTP